MAPENISVADNAEEKNSNNSRKRTRSETEQDTTFANPETTFIQNTSAVTKNVSFILPEEEADAMSVDEEDDGPDSFTDV